MLTQVPETSRANDNTSPAGVPWWRRALLVLGLVFVSNAIASAAPKKILLVGTHPSHRYGEHEYLHGNRVLAACLNQHPDVEAVAINGFPTAEQVRGADAMHLFCSWGGDFVLADADRRSLFLEQIRRGMGYSTLHFACDIRPELEKKGLGDVYMECLGAFYDTGYSRNPHNTVTLRLANVAHPVSTGLTPWTQHDEIYFNLRFMPYTQPIVVGRIPDKDGDFDRRVAWAYERPDGGRSFGYTGAHFHKSFEAVNFRRLLVNGILWTAKADIPSAGASVDFDPAWLVAPRRKSPAGQPEPGVLPSLYRAPGNAGEWQTILDAETFPKWIRKEGANWKFDGRVLTGTGKKGHIFSPRGDYKNFEFKADVKVSADSNSGMYFRAELSESWPFGYEAQVNASHGDPVRSGSLYHFEKVFEAYTKNDTWFTQHIICTGDRIVIRIDDAPVVDVDMQQKLERVKASLAAAQSDEERTKLTRQRDQISEYLELKQGHFAFQQHHDGSVVQYRNVMVRELP